MSWHITSCQQVEVQKCLLNENLNKWPDGALGAVQDSAGRVGWHRPSPGMRALGSSPAFCKRRQFYFIYLFLKSDFLVLAALVPRCYTGFSLVAASGGYSSLWCTSISLWSLLLLWSTGSRASRLQQVRRVGSRAQAQ